MHRVLGQLVLEHAVEEAKPPCPGEPLQPIDGAEGADEENSLHRGEGHDAPSVCRMEAVPEDGPEAARRGPLVGVILLTEKGGYAVVD